MSLQTEFSFELPKGYTDVDGKLHRRGVMRLATAADEIVPMKDPRVQQNPGYLQIIILSRVVVRLGDLSTIDTRIIESLYNSDLNYLQDLYQKINSAETPVYHGVCPKCKENIDIPIGFFKKAD
jgi:hypothetical protein